MGWMFTTPLKGEGELVEVKVKTLSTIVEPEGCYSELIQVLKLGSKVSKTPNQYDELKLR